MNHNLILKCTGSQVPFFVSNFGNFTAHICEAKKFNSIEEAKMYMSTDNRTYQIIDNNSGKFLAWINY